MTSATATNTETKTYPEVVKTGADRTRFNHIAKLEANTATYGPPAAVLSRQGQRRAILLSDKRASAAARASVIKNRRKVGKSGAR
jgi:hypothetical protein